MQNIGEEIAGEYLRIKKNCKFISYNLHTIDAQGEIDVVGIDIDNKKIYLCEVATHLVTGLRYVKDGSSDNVERFLKKFKKNIEYAEKYFSDFEKHFMLWSPIVKSPKQLNDVNEIKERLKKESSYDLDLIINHTYSDCLQELKDYAREETKELKSSVLRLMQVEEKLSEHLSR